LKAVTPYRPLFFMAASTTSFFRIIPGFMVTSAILLS
jgi:hypothetical protein